MSEMMDRVAKELAARDGGSMPSDGYRNTARAILEVMREPTDDMVGPIRPSLLPRDVWREMMKRALGC